MEQTNLQKIVARAADYLKKHIEAAVKSGAHVNVTGGVGAFIDGVCVTRAQLVGQKENVYAIVVYIESDTIANVLVPNKAELQKSAEKLRAELQEIENKLQKVNEHESNNN